MSYVDSGKSQNGRRRKDQREYKSLFPGLKYCVATKYSVHVDWWLTLIELFLDMI